MNTFSKYRDTSGRMLVSRGVRALLSVAMLLAMLVPGSSAAQAQNDRQEQRAAIQQANRERLMQRQQEMIERNQQRQQLQLQRRNQLGIPQQFDPNPGFPPEGGPDNWRERRGLGRMTLEERQALRRQIQEAGRSVYPAPPQNK